MRILMEAFKRVHVQSGSELNKPSVIAMAPTANAAYIICGKTIESSRGLQGTNYRYHKLQAESELKFMY